MNLSIGFSPCPNDTFIFDALVNKKIDTEGIEFTPVLEDVETLNRRALEGKLDITKLSFPAFFRSLENYILLDAGSALGKGVGPLLVAAGNKAWKDAEVDASVIALPGENTTANLLFSYAYPNAINKKFVLFSTIEDAVLNGETALGVIIHENRFTYRERGLTKVCDLGEYWEEKMNAPIPLGGIAVNRRISREHALKTDRLVRKSLEHAFAHYPVITGYVKEHSQAMREEVMRSHIDLYVNNFSLDLGKEGKRAIGTLHNVYCNMHHKEPVDTGRLFLTR